MVLVRKRRCEDCHEAQTLEDLAWVEWRDKKLGPHGTTQHLLCKMCTRAMVEAYKDDKDTTIYVRAG